MKKYFTLSLALHLALGLLCFFSIHLSQQHKNTGNYPKIKAYIYTPQLFSSTSDKININNLHIATKTIKPKNNNHLSHQSQSSPNHQSDLPQAKTSGEKDKLLIILHDLIQKKVLDFVSDLHNISDKTTTVNFTLYPDGHIANLTIAKSSGIAVLDEAAKYAVNEIQPVIAAKELLAQHDSFQIDIVFKKR